MPSYQVPIAFLEAAATPLDCYLLHIREVELTRQRIAFQTLTTWQVSETERDGLLTLLLQQFPTPHLDAVEQRLN